MGKYLFIESRDPFECPDAVQAWSLATALASKGNDVKVFLVQNAVLAARAGARVETLDPAAGVDVLADELSLAERGIRADAVKANVQVSGIETLTDLVMEEGRKPVWT